MGSVPNWPRKKGCHESSNEAARHPILYVSGVAGVNTGRNRRRTIPESGEGSNPRGNKVPS